MRPVEKWLLLLSAAATAVTGGVYAWMRYLLEPVDPWAVIHHPLEPWMLKAHILVSPVLVFAVGMISVGHVWRHLRSRVRSGRRSGLVTALAFLPMVGSGYLIQSLTSPLALRWLVAIHLVTGTLFGSGVALHFREFLRQRQPAAQAADPQGAAPPNGSQPRENPGLPDPERVR